MAIHYKKHPWNDVIDPTFNIIIRKYMETLRLVVCETERLSCIITKKYGDGTFI